MMQKTNYNKAIVLWLLIGAILILAMVVIGGITRLTGSGLSIVEWNVLSGTLPPLTEADWAIAFDKYKKFPEYQKLNTGMTLDGFKQIFWWEYLHRLLGRAIGLVFILPFLYFLIRNQLSAWLFGRLLLILLLGAAQGVMGWLMVKSGLVDNPHVSHFRLAAHLSLAILLIGVILWTVADLVSSTAKNKIAVPSYTKLAWATLALILFQIELGAFVAGLKAGFSYNTYPLMEGELFPSHAAGYLTWGTIWENGIAMQFMHRWVAVLVLGSLFYFWHRIRKADLPDSIKNVAGLMLLAGIVQTALGITTLLLSVPVTLGVLHQVVAVVLFGLAVLATHQLRLNRYRQG